MAANRLIFCRSRLARDSCGTGRLTRVCNLTGREARATADGRLQAGSYIPTKLRGIGPTAN